MLCHVQNKNVAYFWHFNLLIVIYSAVILTKLLSAEQSY